MVRRVVLPVALFALLLPGSALAQQYHRTDLTADSSAASATAPNLDTNLVNACGVCLAGLAVLGHLTLVHNRIIAHGQHVIVYRDRAAIASKSECLVRTEYDSAYGQNGNVSPSDPDPKSSRACEIGPRLRREDVGNHKCVRVPNKTLRVPRTSR